MYLEEKEYEQEKGERDRYCRISETEQLLRGSGYRRRNIVDVDSTPGHYITSVTLDVLFMLSHFTCKTRKIMPSMEGYCE